MIKKISELTEATNIQEADLACIVDSVNEKTKKATLGNLLKGIVPKNAGAHNSIYRGKDITDLFYNGTLSQQIAAGTFDDIFIGDYIIGNVSNRKYLVADINYRLRRGDIECTTPHVLMIPERIMGTARMNDTNTVTGAYVGSKMYTEYLAPFKAIIQNDFGISHIVQHRNYFASAVTNGYESAGIWKDSTIELMNEIMVCGSNIFHDAMRGAVLSAGNIMIDNSQLSLFRLNKSKLVASDDTGTRSWYWLRDVVSISDFASIGGVGSVGHAASNGSAGVRPAFLIK